MYGQTRFNFRTTLRDGSTIRRDVGFDDGKRGRMPTGDDYGDDDRGFDRGERRGDPLVRLDQIFRD